MTAKKEQNNDLEVTLTQTTSKIEAFYTSNKKQINTAIIALVAIVGGYIAFTQLYVKPQNEEAIREMFRAQQYFEKDSFSLALNGNESFQGFEAIAESYGMTQSGNLAHYYAGICCLRTGKFEEAISHLKSFDTDNQLIGVLAKGAPGDAYSESGDLDNASGYYLKAARMSKNKLTSPMFLKKAAIVFEEQQNYSKALDAYQSIKDEYPESTEAGDADKYIARAKALSEN
jgi:tetratricopeptide (TPR) repeat protein